MTHIAREFADWRAAHVEETLRLRDSVGELLKLNNSLREHTLEHINIEERKSAEENSAIFLKLTSQETETKLTADLIRRHFEQERDRWNKDELRWKEVFGHLELVENRLSKIEGLSPEDRKGYLSNNAEKVHVAVDERAISPNVPHVDKLGESVVKELFIQITEYIRVELDKATEKLADHVTEVGAAQAFEVEKISATLSERLRIEREALEKRCVDLSNLAMTQSRDLAIRALEELNKDVEYPDPISALGSPSQITAMVKMLQVLSEKSDSIYRVCSPNEIDAASWAEAGRAILNGEFETNAEEWRVHVGGAMTQAEEVRYKAELFSSEGRDSKNMTMVGQASTGSHPVVDFVRQVDNIEKRGNIRLDLRSGDFELLRPIEFVARKMEAKDPPTAEFVDQNAVEQTLQDVSEVCRTFCAKVFVDVHTKGGETSYWETVAKSRANLIAAVLESRGVKRELMTARGFPGRKGLNRSAVLIHMDLPSN